MHDISSRLEDNFAAVRDRIAAAAQRSGRIAGDVVLVGVTKYVDVVAAGELCDAGCRNLGESRPQELWHKADLLQRPDASWHLIGHLQRNKIRRTLPVVTLIHSVDSLRLLAAIDDEARLLGRGVDVLLEVNCSADAAKHGFSPDELPAIMPELPRFPLVRVRGLMTMAALDGNAEVARRNFAQLRQLRDSLRSQAPPEVSLTQLSMGMSGDFEVAIEEGATLVRVGSALFEGLES